MKSMQPNSVAIFFDLFLQGRGGHGPSPPPDPLLKRAGVRPGGCATYYSVKNSQKLHENEEILQCRAATATCIHTHTHLYCCAICELYFSVILPVADLHGKILDAPPPSEFFQFHAVFGKIWQNRMLALPPPGELAPPPRGNPGSATDYDKFDAL